MAHSGGKITEPVSFADVNYILGTSHTDLGVLCKDSNIKLLSKFKPTDYTGIGNPMIDANFATAQWQGQSLTNGGGYIRNTCGITIPYFIVQESKLSGEYTFLNGEDFPYAINSVRDAKWYKNTPTVFRLADFWKYTHNTPKYSATHYSNSPIYLSNLTLMKASTTQIYATAMMTFQYNDQTEDNVCYWLGLKSLLDAANGSSSVYNLYFGFAILSTSTPNRVVLLNSSEVQIKGGYDSTTGLANTAYVAVEDIQVITGNTSTGFLQTEEVFLVPYIRKTVNVNGVNYRYYFMLNVDSSTTAWKRIKINDNTYSSDTNVRLLASGTSITLTYKRISSANGYYTIAFWLNSNSDVSFHCSGYGTSMNYLYYPSKYTQILPSDGNSTVVNVVNAALGSSQVVEKWDSTRSVITTEYSTASTIFPTWSSETPSAALYTELRFSSSLTSAKISIGFTVLHQENSKMVERQVTFVGTINPSTTTTSNSTIQMFANIV